MCGWYTEVHEEEVLHCNNCNSCCTGRIFPATTQHLSMVSGQVSRRRLPSTQRAYREVWMNAW